LMLQGRKTDCRSVFAEHAGGNLFGTTRGL
jgi:hypothetical protein